LYVQQHKYMTAPWHSMTKQEHRARAYYTKRRCLAPVPFVTSKIMGYNIPWQSNASDSQYTATRSRRSVQLSLAAGKRPLDLTMQAVAIYCSLASRAA